MNAETLSPGVDRLQSTKAQFRKGSPLQSSDLLNHKVGGLRNGLCGCGEVCTRWRSVSRSPSKGAYRILQHTPSLARPTLDLPGFCERRKLVAPRRQRTPELARKHGVNEVTFCKLASRYVGMDVAQLRCLIANRAFADGAIASAGPRDTVVVKLVTAIERSLPLCSHAVAT